MNPNLISGEFRIEIREVNRPEIHTEVTDDGYSIPGTECVDPFPRFFRATVTLSDNPPYGHRLCLESQRMPADADARHREAALGHLCASMGRAISRHLIERNEMLQPAAPRTDTAVYPWQREILDGFMPRDPVFPRGVGEAFWRRASFSVAELNRAMIAGAERVSEQLGDQMRTSSTFADMFERWRQREAQQEGGHP